MDNIIMQIICICKSSFFCIMVYYVQMSLGLRVTYITLCTIAPMIVGILYVTFDAASPILQILGPVISLAFAFVGLVIMLIFSLNYDRLPSNTWGIVQLIIFPVIIALIYHLGFHEHYRFTIYNYVIFQGIVAIALLFLLLRQAGITHNLFLVFCGIVSLSAVVILAILMYTTHTWPTISDDKFGSLFFYAIYLAALIQEVRIFQKSE